MTRRRTTIATAALLSGLLLASATPAFAGDSAPASGSIVGSWKTRTDGVKQTVTFDSEGRVSGDSGCNRFTGSYTVKGSKLKIGPLASTMMFCEGKMDAETAFLTKLQAAVSYQATKKTLKVFTPKDLMTFKAA